MISTRRFVLPAMAAVVVSGGCGDGRSAAVLDDEFGEPVSGGRVVIAESNDMSIPLAITAQTSMDGNLGADVMSMELVRGDWEDGRLVFRTADESPMAIARSYEYVGPDSASLRFHMRSDVRWSDGTPLTAQDVLFTYEIIGEPDLASPLQFYAEHIEQVEAENDSTVVFHFNRAHPDMLAHSAVALLPSHIFSGTPPGEFRNHPTIRSPEDGNLVVSGPYMIGSWERGQRIVLVRNPYFQPAGYLDEIVFRIIPDPTTRLVELQTGSIDVLPQITLEQVPFVREQVPHVRLEVEEKRQYDYIAYNPGGFSAFEDPEIRRALGLAIDVNAMLQALQMDEFAVAAGGPYPPIFADLYDPQGQAPVPYDPDEARQVLESKGWSDTNNDGVLDRDGQPFRFTLVTNTGNQVRADAAQIIQQQWRQLGVDARLQQLEFNTFSNNLRSGNYEAALGGWIVGLSPDLTPWFVSDAPYNDTRYQNAEVEAAIADALARPTAEEAVPYWRDAASQIVQDQPYTWLYYVDTVDGVNNRIRGTKIDTYGPYQNVWEWWTPQPGGGSEDAQPLNE